MQVYNGKTWVWGGSKEGDDTHQPAEPPGESIVCSASTEVWFMSRLPDLAEPFRWRVQVAVQIQHVVRGALA